ncbi:hypothetical protein GWK47_031788 [Chionoecetes opilio]|uniref:Uncharacterized protein n=1 Tax=Chionoecetes opilio TaxID=41210 RepID=A0A8J4YWM2_CHIOP|nr:hypothetical protein GWK47_031788 [Chionoecetes opilio]
MAELTLIVLGDTPPRGIHWSRPGAIHQVRWMVRNLYSMKMFMFAEQLEYDEATVVKLERLNLFLGLFYTPMWMSSTLAADAPANDLQFMKDMMKFKRTDPEIAQAVLQKLENHKWYLTQEVVPFALFGSRLSDKEKVGETLLPSCTPLRSQIASDEGNLCSLRLQPRRLWLI